MKPQRPAPECLTPNTPDRWTHRTTPATREALRVHPGRREIAAPTGNDAQSLALRRFATLRAAMEPTDPAASAREIATILRRSSASPETAEAIARALDHWRIADHARRHHLANIDAIHDPALAHRAAAAARAQADAETIATYIEAQATGDARKVARAISEVRPDLRQPLANFRRAVLRTLNRHAATYPHHTREVAIDDPTTKEHIDNGLSRHGWATNTATAHAVRELLDGLPNPDDPADANEANHADPATLTPPDDPAKLWHDLRVWRGLMTAPSLGMLARTSRRRTNTGRTISDPRRLYTDPDRRAYYRRTRANGGTVVLDCSGSMSLEYDDILAILDAASGATIYAYNYTHPSRPTLHTLAERGRAVAALPTSFVVGGSNGCDGAALRYAAERHNPRDPLIWISDAHYNGRHRGTGDPFLATDLAEVLTASRAITKTSIPEAVAMLERMSRGGHPDPHELPDTVRRHQMPQLRAQHPASLPTTTVGKYAR